MSSNAGQGQAGDINEWYRLSGVVGNGNLLQDLGGQ